MMIPVEGDAQVAKEICDKLIALHQSKNWDYDKYTIRAYECVFKSEYIRVYFVGTFIKLLLEPFSEQAPEIFGTLQGCCVHQSTKGLHF